MLYRRAPETDLEPILSFLVSSTDLIEFSFNTKLSFGRLFSLEAKENRVRPISDASSFCPRTSPK